MIVLNCAGCGRAQAWLWPPTRVVELAWRPTSNGPVCSDECAMKLARDVTPARTPLHIVPDSAAPTKNSTVANLAQRSAENLRGAKQQTSQRRVA